MATRKLIAVDFEVFGRVQGVFFRKHTQKQAKKLEIRGWCRNTDQDTVEGQLEGSQEQVSNIIICNYPITCTCNYYHCTVCLCNNVACPASLRLPVYEDRCVLSVGRHFFPFSTCATRKEWLRNTGSPSSRIDKADFKNEKTIEDYTFSGFSIKH